MLGKPSMNLSYQLTSNLATLRCASIIFRRYAVPEKMFDPSPEFDRTSIEGLVSLDLLIFWIRTLAAWQRFKRGR
jgi:hypothetical protein